MRRTGMMAAIRTRGTLPEPGGAIRTRGAVRMRGARPGARAGARSVNLADLVDQVREDLSGLPLTAVIYGWGGDASRQFLNELNRRRIADDVYWLVPDRPGAAPPPLASGDVMLDLDVKTHQRTLNNLVADIVFVPGEELAKGGLAVRKNHHARAVVVAADASDMEVLMRRMEEPVPFVYRWRGSETVDEYLP